jgi:hypothetical protein
MYSKASFVFLVAVVVAMKAAAQSPPALPAPYTSTVKVNYVRSWDVVAPTIISDSIKTSTSITKAKMTTQYLDGLGRPVQMVIQKGSLITDSTNITSATKAKDVVNAVQYDQHGWEVYQYLPFGADTIGGNYDANGLFKHNPL